MKHYSHPGDEEHNLYVWGYPATAHVSYSDNDSGFGPNAASVAPTGKCRDWSPGTDATRKKLTLAVSYMGTDIPNRAVAYLRPSFSKGQDRTGNIAAGTFVASLTAAF